MKFIEAVMQMRDGIHRAHNFMRANGGAVTYVGVGEAKHLAETEIVRVTRDDMEEYLETNGADFRDLEKLYGEYNAFAKTTDGNTYFAWYDYDR